MKPLILYSLIAFFATTVAASTRPTITFTFYHYPPDIRVVDGKPTGRYIDQLNAVADTAGYDVRWMASTIDEEADMLNEGRRAICSTGRMPTLERAEKWAFLPYLFDVVPGDIVLTLPRYLDRLRAHGNIVSLAKDSTMIGTLLESGIYGEKVDTIIRSNPSWILRTGKTDFQLMSMVLAGRAHYTIVPKDQWEEAKRVIPGTSTLVALENYGAHPDYPIYIACSKGVPKETLRALGDAMAQHGFPPGTLADH
ncbi:MULTISPECIES: transporter substrate-binding domain-containing protein [Kordiimonas]|uniref:transporter substrate-binding domain-containing protein n=1 Tax=Kordiimonas TaxID=288021 RepID=UPI00257BF0E2|nr:transporter substrate-binding domain-containing protein [Kordiimonas sp. UBA4487]